MLGRLLERHPARRPRSRGRGPRARPSGTRTGRRRPACRRRRPGARRCIRPRPASRSARRATPVSSRTSRVAASTRRLVAVEVALGQRQHLAGDCVALRPARSRSPRRRGRPRRRPRSRLLFGANRRIAPSAAGSWTVSFPRPCVIIPARSSTARNRLADSREEPASWASSAWVEVITTSPSPAPSARAVSTSCASTVATRLCTVWNDCRASRSLVSRSRRPSAVISLTAISGCSRSSRRMSAPRIAIASVSSIVSMVAERRSSSNIASSPKMSPGPKCASVIERPSECSRMARAWPGRTT